MRTLWIFTVVIGALVSLIIPNFSNIFLNAALTIVTIAVIQTLSRLTRLTRALAPAQRVVDGHFWRGGHSRVPQVLAICLYKPKERRRFERVALHVGRPGSWVDARSWRNRLADFIGPRGSRSVLRHGHIVSD
jgi:hypothetical protein